MDRPDYLLGIDAGTSVIKVALFDQKGTETHIASRQTTLVHPQPGWAEVSMAETWHMTAAAIRELLELAKISPAQIAGVGITGNMVGAWLIDGRGQPVRNAILWCDGRTRPLFDQLKRQQPDILHQIFLSSGSMMEFGCTLPIIRWLADNEPAHLAQAQAVLCCKDWLGYQLTGSVHLDYTEASVLPGDNRSRSYGEPLFDLLGIRPWRHLFPPVVLSEQVVGHITARAAGLTGLLEGTPVVAGAGDVPASTLGAGAVEPGMACTVLGTTCHNSLVVAQPVFEPPDLGLLFCLPQKLWLRTMVNLTGTTNLNWAIDRFCSRETAAASSPPALFAAVERLARQSSPGAGGIIYHPYLNPVGVIAPFVEPAAKAQLFGLTMAHTRADLVRAVYEGVALAIRDCYAAVTMPEEIRLVGGGGKSEFWSQIIADCTGCRVAVPAGSEFGARGAALLAGVGIGWFTTVSQAAQATISITRVHHPTPALSPIYNAAYTIYRQIRNDVRDSWHLHHRLISPDNK